MLGYANIKISDIGGDFIDDGGFSYGVGASYSITDRWAAFFDVVSLYNDTYIDNTDFWGQNGGFKVKAESINLGVTYTF